MKHVINDTDKNKFEAYDKTEVLAAIQEAISSGELPEEINGLVITLKNPIDNLGYKIAFCTQAKYNELESGGELEVNCYYFITDDSTFDDWNTIITDLQASFNQLEDDVQEALDTGLRLKLTSIECACDFSNWNGNSSNYSSGNAINPIHLKNNSSYGNNAVNILPAGSNTSIAEAKVEYVSGDENYILYSLDNINVNNSYITFTATNVSNGIISGPAQSYGVSRSTTFKLFIKDIYNNEFEKEFTINFKTTN